MGEVERFQFTRINQSISSSGGFLCITWLIGIALDFVLVHKVDVEWNRCDTLLVTFTI